MVSVDFARPLRVPFGCAPSSGSGLVCRGFDGRSRRRRGRMNTVGAVPRMVAVRAMMPTVTKLVLFISIRLSGGVSHLGMTPTGDRGGVLWYVKGFAPMYLAWVRYSTAFQWISGTGSAFRRSDLACLPSYEPGESLSRDSYGTPKIVRSENAP